MTVSSAHQLAILGLSVLAGAACAVVYGFVSVLRRRTGGSAASMAADLAFWLFAAAAVIWLGLRFNNGEIRIYQIFAAVCGFFLYGLCLGGVTAKAAELFFRALDFVFAPVKFLLRGMVLYIKDVYEKIANIKNKLRKNLNRSASIQKTRKKMRKKYKKLL